MPKPRRARKRNKNFFLTSRRFLLVGFLFALVLGVFNANTHAASLTAASISPSDPRPSAGSVAYTFQGSNVTLSLTRCIKLQFADTATGNTVPSGMVTTSATLDTVNTNYVPTPGSLTTTTGVNGTVTLTSAGGQTPASAGARRVVLNGITNSSVGDTRFWLRLNTYSNVDCATGPIDNASVLFILTTASTLTLTVDQTLSFTVNAVAAGQACDGTTTTAASTSTTIPFGTVTASSNAVVCQDLQAATNATLGYTIYARYTAAPTNPLAQTIANHTGTNAAPTNFTAPGTEGYGYSTNDATLGTGTANRFTNPSQNWAAMTTTNAELAYEGTGVTATTYRVGHQVGVSLTTEPGTYSTTVIYTCTPIY